MRESATPAANPIRLRLSAAHAPPRARCDVIIEPHTFVGTYLHLSVRARTNCLRGAPCSLKVHQLDLGGVAGTSASCPRQRPPRTAPPAPPRHPRGGDETTHAWILIPGKSPV